MSFAGGLAHRVPARGPRPTLARLVLLAALGACTSGCATTRVLPYPGTSAAGRQVVAQARTFTGVAYRPGGASPSGFDCSGFVQYLYGSLGVRLPRSAATQFEVGARVRDGRTAAGDLVFFRTDGDRVSHVGIAVGDGTFIHAPNPRSGVRTDRLDATYWSARYAGARRVVR